jgi:type I restriction enzyme S subunit
MKHPQPYLDGWGVSSLGSQVVLANGSAFKAEDWKTEGIPIVRIQNLKDRDAPFNYYDGPLDSKVVLSNGDLLFSWSGSIGTSFGPHIWWGTTAVLNQHIFRVDVRDSSFLERGFLYFALRHLTARIEARAYGLAALVHVRKGDLENIPVPIPPLAEQRQITVILSAVQRAIERQGKLIALTVELKKSLMHKLFTEGTRGEPLKLTEIGTMPESWKIARLADMLCEPLRNGHSAKETSNPHGIRTLTLTAVTRADFSLANTKTTVAAAEKVRNLWLREGDILVERANTVDYVGLAALYEGPDDFSIFPDLLVRVRLHRDRMRPKVLCEYLVSPRCRTYFQMNAKGTAGSFPKIDQGAIENLLVPVPNPEEQVEVEHAARTLDIKYLAHITLRARLEDLFRALLNQLMTPHIRVQDLDLSTLAEVEQELAGVA